MQDDVSEPLYQRKQAAKVLTEDFGIPTEPTTLAKWACVGGGPEFYKAGRRPLYPRSSLAAWARQKLGSLRHSTS